MTIPAEVAASGLDPLQLVDLDLHFGEALSPIRIHPLESSLRPRSLHKLDADSAALMKKLIEVTDAGLGITRYVYAELPILWVVDQDGHIWFSIEEVVNEDSHEFVLPRLRNMRVDDPNRRLGHPSLIGGNFGRIGGEILFDTNAPQPAWFISNASGRYGLRPGRSEKHLSNVASIFSDYGITLKEFFIPARQDA